MSKTIFWRSPYNYDTEEASNLHAIPANEQGESMTVQSMTEEADINVLMHRYGITGKMPENPRLPTFGDFSGINDYQSALNAIMDAQEGFMELPAAVRARFDNDPQKLLAFCEVGSNREEAIKLGLVKRQPGEVEPGALDTIRPATALQAPSSPPAGPAVAVPPPKG